MNKSTKAALLSGLVFPGLGHLYLKRWAPGIVLAGVAGYALYIIVSIAMRIALDLSEQIETGAIPPDVATITHLVTEQLSGSEQVTNIASWALVACWVVGIVTSWLQGRVQDRRDAQANLNRASGNAEA